MTSYSETYNPSRSFSLEALLGRFYTSFKTQARFHALFHVGFLAFLSLQLISFVLFFSYFSKSALTALALAFFVLTLFSYLVLWLFFDAKKIEQWISLREEFVKDCKQLYHLEENLVLKIGDACRTAALFLHGQEEQFYPCGISIKSLSPVIEKAKIKLYWKNFHQMKELLFLLNLEQLVLQIKLSADDVDTHAALAQGYTELGLLYLHPGKLPSSPFSWIPPDYNSAVMQSKFSLCMERAIEECLILQAYGIKGKWIHAKLAEIYGLQGKAEEELFQYEELLSLDPSNIDVLVRLGMLCFKQGYNAKGLTLYEQLKKISPIKAEELIAAYDSRSLGELSGLVSLTK